MPCIRLDRRRRGPGRPRIETAALTHSRTSARLPRRQKRGSASSKDYDSNSDFGGLHSASDSDTEYDFADINLQSDSDGDVESDFADVDPQSGSTTGLDCDVISLSSGRDSGYNSDRNVGYRREARTTSVCGSGREVVPLRKVHNRTHDGVAELIKQKIAQHKKDGPSAANHRPRTKEMIEMGRAYWHEFCLDMGYDDHKTLEECDPAVYKGFIEWRIVLGRIHKLSSATTYWKVHSMFYAGEVHEKMKDAVLLELRNWMPQYLPREYGLEISDKEKSCIYVADLLVYIHGNWVRDTQVYVFERLRIQRPLVWLFGGFTTTRPEALLSALYKDVRLTLVRGKGRMPVLALTLRLENVKRSEGESRPKEFTFFEGADLPLCPLIHFLPLVFIDGAFESDLSSPEQIYQLVIPARKDKLEIHWKREWRDRPFIRDIEHTPDGVQLSDTKALDYQKLRKDFRSIGRELGMRKLPEWYDLRRAGGKLITEAYTPEECNQIMGQRSRSTYGRYYIPPFIDRACGDLYCGVAPRDDLIREVGRQARDELAPKHLTPAQRSEIRKDPQLVEYEQKREACKDQIHDLGYKKIPDARGKTAWYDRYIEANAKFNARHCLLKDRALKAAIDEYHERVDTIEINNQLKGIMPDTEVAILPNIDYELADRAIAARLFFTPLDTLEASQVFQLRIDLIKCLIRLGPQRESPRVYRQKDRTRTRQAEGTEELPKSNLGTDESVMDVEEPPEDALFCGWCRWTDKPIGPKQRYHIYARIDNLEKHVRKQHFESRATDQVTPCPYTDCEASLGSSMHFMTHRARVHCSF